MKKVKVMLTVMIVFGTVGGVLAVKAKRSVHYCTTATVNNICPVNAKCPNGTVRKITLSGGGIRCYVLTMNSADCAKDMPACHEAARFTAE